jgi:RNA polymerase sigma-70 factor (ECF subfamily)
MSARKDKEMELALDLDVRARSRNAKPRTAAAEECSDGELLERIAGGDREAFDVLYRRFVRPVFALAMRRLGDRGRAEDAAQEAFASVWRAARTYRSDRGPVAPWLYAVARNAIADRGRARVEPPAEPVDSPSDEPGPDAQAEQSWLAWRVHSAMDTLPESERAVLELAYWRGLSQSEIATELAIPLGTVKTRTRAGLARLADELEGEELR